MIRNITENGYNVVQDTEKEKKKKPNIPQDQDNAHSCKHQRKEGKWTPAKLNKNMVEKHAKTTDYPIS